jgi:hypothetical protein
MYTMGSFLIILEDKITIYTELKEPPPQYNHVIIQLIVNYPWFEGT